MTPARNVQRAGIRPRPGDWIVYLRAWKVRSATVRLATQNQDPSVGQAGRRVPYSFASHRSRVRPCASPGVAYQRLVRRVVCLISRVGAADVAAGKKPGAITQWRKRVRTTNTGRFRR